MILALETDNGIWHLAAGLGLFLFGMLADIKTHNEAHHSAPHAAFYEADASDLLAEVLISTLLNVDRELYLSNQSLLPALAEALLDTHSATDFESIPGGG